MSTARIAIGSSVRWIDKPSIGVGKVVAVVPSKSWGGGYVSVQFFAHGYDSNPFNLNHDEIEVVGNPYQQYQQWIDAKLTSADPFTKCAEWTIEMNSAFPELIRVRGQVLLSNLWERDHWWLKTGEGEIVDPTKAQFTQEYYGVGGGATVLIYQERDESEPEPTGMCANCGGYIYGGRDTVCSDSCARAYCAYLGVGWRARHLGGGVVQLYEAHATDEDCRDFCAARKAMMNSPVKFFPIAISEEDLPSKDARDA